MEYVFAFFAGVFITIVAIPPLWRFAGALQLIDKPNWRKVHETPVPRVGGIAIGFAIAIAAIAWVPMDGTIIAYLVAAGWILLFGAIDDAWNLNYKWKLAAQVPPVMIMIYSGVVMLHLPFFGLDPAPTWISIPITVLFFLGITNAVNLFDGLDGLAGGCMLLSLAAIAYLAGAVDGNWLVLLCLIMMGGILGFLNFNTHPARVFLGDAGSQLLGFSVAVFSIFLTENIHTALNPALPFLLLGLPLLDTTWVFFLRVSQGKSPFRPDRQHLHHQLLDGGLGHLGAVSSIYLFQAVLVGTAIAVPYGSDVTVVGLLFLEWTALLALILYNRRHANSHPGGDSETTRTAADKPEPGNRYASTRDAARRIANYIVEAAMAMFVLGTIYTGFPFGRDIAIITAGTAVVILFAALFMSQWTGLFTRIGFYVACVLAIYIYEPVYSDSLRVSWALTIFLATLGVVLIVSIALTRRETFQVSPQDLLVGFIAVAAAALRPEFLADVNITFVAMAAVILFYACEYIISVAEHRYLILRIATVGALSIYSFRGFL